MFLTLKKIPRTLEIGTRWERTFLLSGKERYKKKRYGVPGCSGQ